MKGLVTLNALLAMLFLVSPLWSSEPVRVGVSLGLTGEYALTSGKQKKAYELFQEDFNNNGGILGRPVQFVFYDNGSKVATAREQYEKLIVEDHVDFVFGPYTSTLTKAIAPVVEKYGYPTLIAGAAADSIWQQGYENTFGMWTPASRYVLGFLKLLVYNKLDRIAIVTGDGAFASGLAEGARKWARVLRLDVVDYIMFPEGIKDFSAIAEQLRAHEPNIVICTGHYYVGAGIKRALQKVEWQPRLFYATVSPTFQKYYDDFGEQAELDFSTAIWEPHPRLKYPGSYEFAKRYEKKYGDPPNYHAASAYAAGEVLMTAIREAGSTDRNNVRSVLQRLNTTTILGRYSVDKTGLQIKRYPLIVQWQKGQKEIVWPIELLTSPVIIREP